MVRGPVVVLPVGGTSPRFTSVGPHIDIGFSGS